MFHQSFVVLQFSCWYFSGFWLATSGIGVCSCWTETCWQSFSCSSCQTQTSLVAGSFNKAQQLSFRTSDQIWPYRIARKPLFDSAQPTDHCPYTFAGGICLCRPYLKDEVGLVAILCKEYLSHCRQSLPTSDLLASTTSSPLPPLACLDYFAWKLIWLTVLQVWVLLSLSRACWVLQSWCAISLF